MRRAIPLAAAGRLVFALLLGSVVASCPAAPDEPQPTVAQPTAPQPAVPPAHFADANDAAAVLAGRDIYRANCARCHGRRLEGQALWQLRDRFYGQRADALEERGHAWQHPDEELYRIVREGRPPGQPADVASRMPAFAERLDDRAILQALAFIKSRWSLGIRAAQASLNPDMEGMPAGADQIAWRLPANCSGIAEPQGP